MEITVTVRDIDVATLTEIAAQEWRNVDQQASAMLEQALQTRRARSDGSSIPRMRRGRAPRNGATALVSGTV